MTKTNMTLAELAEKGADADFLRQMIQHVAQRMMEMDVEGLCAAPRAAACRLRPAMKTPDRPPPGFEGRPDLFVQTPSVVV